MIMTWGSLLPPVHGFDSEFEKRFREVFACIHGVHHGDHSPGGSPVAAKATGGAPNLWNIG